MKITLIEAVRAYQAILELSNQTLDFSTAHVLVMEKKELETHVQFYSQSEKELVEKYALRNEQNEIIRNGNQFQLLNDHVDEFNQKMNELDSVEIDIAVRKLKAIPNIKPSTLEPLMCVFEFLEN